MTGVPPSTVPAWDRVRSAALAWAASAAWLVMPGAAAGPPVFAADAVTVTTLVDDLPGAGPLAVSPNGQTVYCLDAVRRAVIAFDALTPGRGRDVVAAAVEGLPVPVAIGCLPGDVLAIVARSGDEWSLRTFRIRPGDPADPSAPLQSLPLGGTTTPSPAVRLAVSHTRDWLAVVGLPAPLAPVLRSVFAGTGLRPLADDGWPGIAVDCRPVAAAVSPGDELVLFEQPRDEAATAAVVYHGGMGPELLRLDTGLPQVRDAAFGRGDGTLWVIAGDAGSSDLPEGLWRLDAVMRDGRQAVRPTCVARLPAPRSMVAVSERSVVVAATGSIVRIDPGAARGRGRHDDEEQGRP